MAHTDQQYLDDCIKPTTALWRKMYEKCVPKITAMVLKNSGDKEDALDLFQEALLAICDQVKKKYFELTCPFEAFLYQVCYNMWMNELKKRKRRVTFFRKYLYTQKDFDQRMTTIINEIVAGNKKNKRILPQDKEACEQARLELFEEKLKELGNDCRELMEMLRNGMPPDVVAEKLGVNYNNLRVRRFRCKQRLTELMQASPKYEFIKNCMYE